MVSLVAGLSAIVAAWFLARWFGRGKPCPVLVAAMFDNPVAERLSGTGLLIERALVEQGMRVLDAGCGPGRVTMPIARRVGPEGLVVALDVQQGMLERVTANARRAGLTNVRTLLGALEANAKALRDHEQAFDRVLLVTVLGEIPDQKGALESLYNTLKPGGILSVTEMIIDPDYVPRARVQELATAAGFENAAAFGAPLMFTANFRRPA